MSDFIRGYFDGDGCITYSIRKPNPKNRELNYRVTGRFEICSKLSNILIDFQRYLSNTNISYIKRDNMYNLNYHIYYYMAKNEKINR